MALDYETLNNEAKGAVMRAWKMIDSVTGDPIYLTDRPALPDRALCPTCGAYWYCDCPVFGREDAEATR